MMRSVQDYLKSQNLHDCDIAMDDYRRDGDKIIVCDNELDASDMAVSIGIAQRGDDAAKFLVKVLDKMASDYFPEAVQLSEFNETGNALTARFTYDVDSLGDVLVRDTDSDKEIWLHGEDALELLAQLPDNASEGIIQHVLSQYQHVMEGSNSLDEDIAAVKDSVIADGLANLVDKANQLDNELQRLKKGARSTGDTRAFFAFEHFEGQIKKLRDDITHYLTNYH
jgi:uncharacterized protein YdcH (DUF465 family)